MHSLANGPEVTKPLLETSRRGYLAASSASAYSMVSLVQRFGPVMPKGGTVVSLTYIASEKVKLRARGKRLPSFFSLLCFFEGARRGKKDKHCGVRNSHTHRVLIL